VRGNSTHRSDKCLVFADPMHHSPLLLLTLQSLEMVSDGLGINSWGKGMLEKGERKWWEREIQVVNFFIITPQRKVQHPRAQSVEKRRVRENQGWKVRGYMHLQGNTHCPRAVPSIFQRASLFHSLTTPPEICVNTDASGGEGVTTNYWGTNSLCRLLLPPLPSPSPQEQIGKLQKIAISVYDNWDILQHLQRSDLRWWMVGRCNGCRSRTSRWRSDCDGLVW
jgi:hypothetical protein